MRLTIKTLEGNTFEVDVGETDSVAQVKNIIEQSRSDFTAAHQKLILAGKVLKDEQTINELGITDKSFLVCVVTKPKTARAAPAAAPAAAPVAAPAPAPAPAAAPASVPMAVVPPAATQQSFEQPESIQRLVDMGFPEAEARAALRAARGDPDVAVEFLFNGIPESALRAAAAGSPAGAGVSPATGADMLEQLRRHPDINRLRAMVQQNPAALQTILQQIGSQNPELLNVIHQNQQAFLSLMNEPITEDPAGDDFGGDLDNLNPQQFVQLLRSTPPEQRQQVAAALGMTPEQLQGMTDMLSNMPPEQLQQMMAMFRGMSGAGAMGAGGAGRPPQNAIRLTEDEMAAVQRLTELGFDQNDAVQVFLACDKNEALAANVLMDGWNGGMGGLGGAGGADDYQEGGDDDNDDMYR